MKVDWKLHDNMLQCDKPIMEYYTVANFTKGFW